MSAWDDMRALLPDNSTGDITAQDMRDVVTLLEGVDADNFKAGEDKNIYLSTTSAVDLADTIAAIVDATSSKRYVIEMGPGVHTTKPVTMKSYVFIKGSAESATVVNPTGVSETMFTMADSSGLKDLQLSGASSGIGVSWTGSGFCYLDDVSLINCGVGVTVNGSGSNMVWRNGTCNGTLTTGFQCYAGNVTLSNIAVSGVSTLTTGIELAGPNVIATVSGFLCFSPNVVKGIRVGDDSQTVLNTCSVVNASAVGVQVDTGARCVIKGGSIFQNLVGLLMPADASAVDLEVTGATVLSNTTDFSLLNSSAKVRLNAVTTSAFNSDTTPTDLIGQVVDETAGDEGVQVFGELKVGRPASGSESCMGEGDSYAGSGKMYGYTWSGAAWADVTADLSSPSGSSVEFPNGNPDTALYLASRVPQNGSFLKHGGFKMSCTGNSEDLADLVVSGSISPDTTGNYFSNKALNGQYTFKHDTLDYWIAFVQGYWCIFDSEPDSSTKRNTAEHHSLALEGQYGPVNGTGTATVAQPTVADDFAMEYYDGTSWVEMNYMMTESANSYQSHAKEIFLHTGSFQIRYDARLDADLLWEPSDPMSTGDSLYWIRIRIKNAISASPTIEQIKLHSNRTEINADGYLEFFGKARPFTKLPWDMGLLEAFGASPANVDLYVSDDLGRGYVENGFGTGEYVGFNAYLPNQVDTSTPIKLLWSAMSTAVHTDITWTVRWGYTRDGDGVYTSTVSAPTLGPNENSVTVTAPMPVSDTQYTFSAMLDISNMLPTKEGSVGDILWVTLERTSGGGGADVAVINILPLYCQYVLGGHI